MELELVTVMPIMAFAIATICGFGVGWEISIPAAADEVGWVMFFVMLIVPMFMLMSQAMAPLVAYYFLAVVVSGFLGGILSEINQRRLQRKYI